MVQISLTHGFSSSSSSFCSSSSISSQNSLHSQSTLPSLQSTPSLPIESPYCSIATLKGRGHVSCLAIVAEGILCVGFTNGAICLWEVKFKVSSPSTGEEEVRFGDLSENEKNVGAGSVKALAVAGNRLLSCHQDGKIRAWKWRASRPKLALVATLPTLMNYLLTFLPPKNYVQVRRHKRRLWIEHVDAISTLGVCNTTGLLYSASWDRTVKVWRLSNLSCVESFRAHNDAINALVVSMEGAHVYTASADTLIKVWSRQSAKVKHVLLATLRGHTSAVNALALSSDGSLLYSGACDHTVIAWAQQEGGVGHMATAMDVLHGHHDAVLSLATTNGGLLCSGSADRTVRVWKRKMYLHTCVAILQGHNAPVKSICVSHNTQVGACLIYVGSLNQNIKVWYIPTPPCLHQNNEA